MDTRRRADSGERFGASPSSSGDAQEDLESQTKVVRLSDLQPVAPRAGGTPPILVVGIVAVAVLAFAMGAGFRDLNVEPSPTAPPIAVVSSTQSPTAVATATPRPTSTPRPLATPQPTTAPRWAWTRHEFPSAGSLNLNDGQVWAIGDQVLAVVNRVFPNGNRAGVAIARLEPGRDWHVVDAPHAIDALYAGTVIDGKLWFVARVSQIGDPTWQLVSTTDGESFETIGESFGLGVLDGVSFLGRVGGRWVAATWVATGGSDGAAAYTLRSSEDGVLWEDATVPSFDGDVTFQTGASNGRIAIAIGHEGGESPNDAFVLRTDDGQSWERTRFNVPSLDPTVARCLPATCFVSGYEYETEAPPVVWSSPGGRSWTASATDARIGTEYEGISYVVPVDGGLLAMADHGPWAFVSRDGVDWRAIAVLPAQPDDASVIPDSIAGVAVAGDVVIALVEPFGTAAPAYWRGSLSAMLAAP